MKRTLFIIGIVAALALAVRFIGGIQTQRRTAEMMNITAHQRACEALAAIKAPRPAALPLTDPETILQRLDDNLAQLQKDADQMKSALRVGYLGEHYLDDRRGQARRVLADSWRAISGQPSTTPEEFGVWLAQRYPDVQKVDETWQPTGCE